MNTVPPVLTGICLSKRQFGQLQAQVLYHFYQSHVYSMLTDETIIVSLNQTL